MSQVYVAHTIYVRVDIDLSPDTRHENIERHKRRAKGMGNINETKIATRKCARMPSPISLAGQDMGP